MKRTCVYCGRIHDAKYVCPKKPQMKYKKYSDPENLFRGSSAWKSKRLEIRERDLHICRVCYDKKGIYNSSGIQIHHISSLANDYSRRLDNDNLISLCTYHHELAERGELSADYLIGLAASDIG